MTTSHPNALQSSSLATAFGPRVPLARHAAPASWGATARQDLARALRKLDTTITELSDARELLGFDRLSEGSDWDRAHCLENLESPELQAALATVRERRAWLLESLKSSVDWKARRQAHKILGLQGERDLRLGELTALYAQARICELADETPRSTWASVTRPLHARRYTEAELFAGAAAL